MSKFFSIIFFVCFILFIQSCSQRPFACFQTDVDEDSIHVNQVVTFDAVCSSYAKEFYWQFYDNEDSVFFSRTVQRKFSDTGNVKVYLLVTGGRKTSSMTKEIHVNP